VKQGVCFAIMPFSHWFDDVDEVVAHAAGEAGLRYLRSDRRNSPGRVMSQVLSDITEAAVVVADVTGQNPNVFYELALAHHLKGPDAVVIIAAEDDHKPFPFDVHEFRQLRYAHNQAGLRELRFKLPQFIRAAEASAQDPHKDRWDVVRGRLPRTRLLVSDLQKLIESRSGQLEGVTIRTTAGLGSLAISDHEQPDPAAEPEYRAALLAERNTMRAALLAGARLKAVLNPPRSFPGSPLSERHQARYRRLIGLLEGRSDIAVDSGESDADLAAIARCEFVLWPVPMPNLLILGDRVAFEGIKRSGGGGFDMTHWETSPDGIRTLTESFDRLFAFARDEGSRLFPPDGQVLERLRGFFEGTAPA
jgi:hypothetical protein